MMQSGGEKRDWVIQVFSKWTSLNASTRRGSESSDTSGSSMDFRVRADPAGIRNDQQHCKMNEILALLLTGNSVSVRLGLILAA